MDLSTLRWVHFNGGEPLLSKTHLEFLQALPNKEQVHINYNTNATILPDQTLIDLWQQFKLVKIDFSIDDIEQRFEYQRYPANWMQIKDNLQWYIDHAPHNCMFAVNTTISILNHANLYNLDTWLKQNFYISRFTDPIEHRKQLAHGLFALDGAQQRIHNIKRFLESCDARRGTNWREVFPELVNYLD
jgi:sulfatase maturation enzyme AslB (radical SAM superfamily)